MDDREKLLETMRRNLRRIAPQLAREGWTEEEVAEVSLIVREHIAADNSVGMAAVAQWLDDRVWALVEQERQELAEARAREKAVSFGPEQEAQVRELNRIWARPRTMHRESRK